MSHGSKLLDLFCGVSGAAYGYRLAGFHVTGIDHHPQPGYRGNRCLQAEALAAEPWGWMWKV